jgi:transposase-like protein
MTTTAKKTERKKPGPKPKTAEEKALTPPNPADWPEWAESAYRLHARGQRNMTALSRQFGVKWETCRDWIQKVGLFMAQQELHAQDYALAEYVAGMEEILGQAQATYAKTKNDNAKIGALRVAGDMLQNIAAARGVVTKRSAEDVSGDLNVHNDAAARVADRVAKLAARRAREVSGVPEG